MILPYNLRDSETDHQSTFCEWIYLGATLIGYLLVLMSIDMFADNTTAKWLRLFLPNIWLIVCICLFLRGNLPRLNFNEKLNILAIIIAIITIIVLFTMAATIPDRSGEMVSLDIARMMVLVILVPIAEELYFRGVLFTHLRKHFGNALAILLVSMLFGFLHFPLGLFLPMAGMSLVLCLTVLLTKNLVWVILFHALWNALVVMKTLPTPEWRYTLAVSATLLTSIVIILLQKHSGKYGDKV